MMGFQALLVGGGRPAVGRRVRRSRRARTDIARDVRLCRDTRRDLAGDRDAKLAQSLLVRESRPWRAGDVACRRRNSEAWSLLPIIDIEVLALNVVECLDV